MILEKRGVFGWSERDVNAGVKVKHVAVQK